MVELGAIGGILVKKLLFITILAIMLALSACSNTTKETVSDETTVTKIEELEKEVEDQNNTIVEQEKIIEEQKKIIENIKMKQESNKSESKDNNQDNTNKSTPTFKLGETFSDDKLEITLSQVVYTSAPNKGVQVYFEVTNNSEEPLESPGILKFKLDNTKYEEEFNRLGYGMNFDSIGFIYQGEKRSGNYHFYFERDFKVLEVTYHINESGYAKQPIATWIIE